MSGHFTAAASARLTGPSGTPEPLTPPPGGLTTQTALLRAALAAAPRAGFCLAPPRLVTSAPSAPPTFETLTGGSTGSPKRIRRSQQSWIASFEVNREAWALGPESEIAALGSLAHSLSLYGAFEAAHVGAGFHLLAGLRPDRQAAALAARRVTLLWATPAQLRLLPAGGPVPSLSRLLVGGGALDRATRAHARTLFPEAEIIPFYGAAETSFITLAEGRPYPGVALEIRDSDAAGIGTVWVRSPYLFEGYAGGADPMRDARGFTTVHERGHLDAEGRLHLAGRADRAVRIAEQTVQPEAVEAALLALPGVAEAAALPGADAARGCVLHAAYIATGPADPPDALLRALRAVLGPRATPRSLTPISPEDWPRRPSGKTDLAALARLLNLAPPAAPQPAQAPALQRAPRRRSVP